MDTFSSLMGGFAVALSLNNLLFALVGTGVGMLVGVLPGLGPAAATAHDCPVPCDFRLRIGACDQQAAGDLHHLGRRRRFDVESRDEGPQRIAPARCWQPRVPERRNKTSPLNP